MKRANKFLVPPNWQVILNDLGINLQEALAYAELPPALFKQEKIQLSPAQYFQLWHGIEAASKGIELPLRLAEVMTLESFDVPIFAAVCSPNFNAALNRLKEYKPLIGPMLMELDITSSITKLEISCYGYQDTLPKCFLTAELVFFTQLIRLATRKAITPVEVVLPQLPNHIEQYQNYFGCSIKQGEKAGITFSADDAKTPFLTSNDGMLNFFEGELQEKLKQVYNEVSFTDRVSTALLKSLPQGESSIEYIAAQLAMSKRSLQRKLTSENQSYQKVLQQVREELAEHYLTNTQLSILEVAFLLGFQESNSFIRAYNLWTGTSPAKKRGAKR